MSELTERRFRLKCSLKFFTKTIREDTGKGTKSYFRKMCLLIPQESDERTRFLTAWLPDTVGEHYELGGFLSHPVDSPCRMSLHRADERSDRHYLFIMTKGVEDILLRLQPGAILSLETYGEGEDSEIDHAVDTNLDIEAQK